MGKLPEEYRTGFDAPSTGTPRTHKPMKDYRQTSAMKFNCPTCGMGAYTEDDAEACCAAYTNFISDELKEKMKVLVWGGLSPREVADHFGKSPSAVYDITKSVFQRAMKEFGLPSVPRAREFLLERRWRRNGDERYANMRNLPKKAKK